MKQQQQTTVYETPVDYEQTRNKRMHRQTDENYQTSVYLYNISVTIFAKT